MATTNSDDQDQFPFHGPRGDALIALLGPKALSELRTLIRLAEKPERTSSSAQSDLPDELDQAA